MSWEKTSVIQFLSVNEGKLVQIGETSTRVKFRGTLIDFNEMDMCSNTLIEVSLALLTPGLDISLTCHDDFLGIHIMTERPDLNDPEVSLPYHIRYENLQLILMD